jgi:L,D-transpeptidase catalytic domain
MRAAHRITTGLTLAVVAASGGWWSGSDRRDGEAGPDACSSAGEPGVASVDTSTDLRLLLNVPAYRLDVVEQGAITRTITVAVGQPKYRTPLGHFQIDYAVWNPWWRPPPSDWARKERPQAPGWSNPVGRVKLHVTGLVFLHGTPNEASLGTAASHACVRMANADAIALARVIHAHAGPAVSPRLLDELIADTARTRLLSLSTAVPVDIVYVLAEVRDTDLVLYPDVYRYAGSRVPRVEDQAMRALRTIGGDTVAIDVTRVRALVHASRRARVRLPLDSLFAVTGETSGPADRFRRPARAPAADQATTARRSSTAVTPDALQAARSTSARSGQERTVPVSVTLPSTAET